MLIEVKETKSTRFKNRTKKIMVLKCDYCDLIFEKGFNSFKLANSTFHFCSRPCLAESKKEGNLLFLKIRETIRTIYNCDNVSQNKDIKEKKKETTRLHYNVDHHFQSKEIRAKAEETNEQRYGFKVATQNKEVQAKIVATNMEKYQVPYTVLDPEIKKKGLDTLYKNYGVTNPSLSPEIQVRREATFEERYNVKNPTMLKEIRDKIDYHDLWLKAHETKKKNGTYKKSKTEDKFYNFLVSQFLINNVSRQILMFDKIIDFLVVIENKEIFIEFDGIYFHGLDRPIQIIEESLKIRDKYIAKRYWEDRWLDQMMNENNKVLVRVTDKEFKLAQRKNNYVSILDRINDAYSKTEFVLGMDKIIGEAV